MNPLPKDKRRLVQFICEQGGACEGIKATGEIRIRHPNSARIVKTSHWTRDNLPPMSLQLLVKDIMRARGADGID